MKQNKKAFSIIEILVGMFIFSLGIISVYLVINATFNLNQYNKDFIIASNLAREQLELVRNVRDSNYKNINKYNQLNPAGSEGKPQSYFLDDNNFLTAGNTYIIENDYLLEEGFPISIDLKSVFNLETNKDEFELCLDPDNKYKHGNCTGEGDSKTRIYKYITVQEMTDIDDALQVTSHVIWYHKGYHDFEVSTVIADWKRL